jgi:hypothetical protein
MNSNNVILIIFSIALLGCQSQPSSPMNVTGNNITYQHGVGAIAINKALKDANAQCVSLGYKLAKVAYSSCTSECVTNYICE